MVADFYSNIHGACIIRGIKFTGLVFVNWVACDELVKSLCNCKIP